MANYWLSFKVKKADRPKGNYDERRKSIYDVATPAGDEDMIWKETTSYILFSGGDNI